MSDRIGDLNTPGKGTYWIMD